MLFNAGDLDTEVRDLHSKILERRTALRQGLKDNTSFENLRTIYSDIRIMENRLQFLLRRS